MGNSEHTTSPVGKRYGKLLILEFHSGNRNSRKFITQCDCGEIAVRLIKPIQSSKYPCCIKCQKQRASEEMRKRQALKRMDLTGAKSGFLIYIKEADWKNSRKIYVQCRACNKAPYIIGAAVFLRGKIMSCGCFNTIEAKRGNHHLFKSLAGQKFGRLTVIRRIDNRGRRVFYECRCDCGNLTDKTAGALKNGTSSSCGCLSAELASVRLKAKHANKRI